MLGFIKYIVPLDFVGLQPEFVFVLVLIRVADSRRRPVAMF
jgi:hypothetical protein